MNLVTASTSLSRRLYASLPWGYRVAQLLVKLADYRPADFGRFMYNMFVMVGIQDMPSLPNGQPPKVPSSPRQVTVPAGYGVDFGKKAFGLATNMLAKYKIPATEAGDVLEELAMRFLDRNTFSKLEGTVKDAERFVFMAINHEITNLYRKKKIRNHIDLYSPDEDGGEIQELMRDPKSLDQPGDWKDLGRILDPKRLHQVQQELVKIDWDTAEYFDLLMNGETDRHIVQEKKLRFLQENPMTIQGWSKNKRRLEMLETIKDVLTEQLSL
jgi:hypothetical protein